MQPYPSEIMEKIDNLPLLQRESIAKHYVGLKVDWEVTINFARQAENNVYMFNDEGQRKLPMD